MFVFWEFSFPLVALDSSSFRISTSLNVNFSAQPPDATEYCKNPISRSRVPFLKANPYRPIEKCSWITVEVIEVDS